MYNSDPLGLIFMLSFLFSSVPTMPQNLSCVAKPFTVLSRAWLAGFYLPRGDEVSELLLAAYNVHGVLLSEGEV